MQNEYVPFLSQIKEVIRHTDIEYTFRMEYEGNVKPGQFFEVSLPKYGEAPISVSGIGDGTVDLTIRKVGKVTGEIFELYLGDKLFLRGPYGNGFDADDYRGKELVVIAGGTGLSPVRGIIEHFHSHPQEVKSLHVIAGFKSAEDMLFRDDLKKWAAKNDVILTVDKLSSKQENDSKEICPLPKDLKEGLVTVHIKNLSVEDRKNAAAIVVGPPIMMKFAVQELLKEGYQEENIWISHERKMCCGIGKCGHCKIDDVYVCLDGPVFRYVKGRYLVD